MVRETLRKALEDAVGYYNGGLSADAAVVKSAAEHDLTIDQTDRVVESFNTAKTINYFDKTADDRTGTFDLANKENVTLQLFGGRPEKKACARVADPDMLSDAFYASRPDRTSNRKDAVSLRKSASFVGALAEVCEEKWAHGYSDNTLNEMASDAYQSIKSAESDIDRAVGALDVYIVDTIEKIAKDLSSGGYEVPQERTALFKAACPHGFVVDEVSKRNSLLKKASPDAYRRMNVIDTTSVDGILADADGIMDALGQRAAYCEKKASFEKTREKLRDAMLHDPSMGGVAEKTAESLIHAPREKKADTFDTNLERLFSTIYDGSKRKKDNERIRDDVRGSILADLMSSDPILQDADPRQVASIYRSIVTTSPRVSLNKEVVRSVLRGAVNSVAISPPDIKVLTDVDKGIQTSSAGIAQSRDR